MIGCASPLRRLSALAGKPRRSDPFEIFAPHLKALRTDLLNLLHSSHPALSELAQYYFKQPSKQIRPLLVLLFSQATNGLGKDWQLKLWESTHPSPGGYQDGFDIPFSPPNFPKDYSPRLPKYTEGFHDPFVVTHDCSRLQRRPCLHSPKSLPGALPTTPTLYSPTAILRTQLRLAQITEMLHTASLFHDDVIDISALRRGVPSVPSQFTNKLSVLGGNFIVGRAFSALAQLGDTEVVRLLCGALRNLAEGEILQMKDAVQGDVMKLHGTGQSQGYQDAWNSYLQKTHLKTASLMAKSTRAAVILGGCIQGEIWREIAYAYGRNIGIAFQLVDDMLDYESAPPTLGKPGNADLKLGLTTAPALYAWEEFPEMGELISRKFKSPGDAEKVRDFYLNRFPFRTTLFPSSLTRFFQARDIVHRSSAISRTKQLAQTYANEAKNALQKLPHSEARDALEVLAERVIERKH